MNKTDLQQIIVEALKEHGGQASIVDVCKYAWKNYESDLAKSGNLFFTWQYDIRWAATELRKAKIMVDKDVSRRGVWELVKV